MIPSYNDTLKPWTCASTGLRMAKTRTISFLLAAWLYQPCRLLHQTSSPCTSPHHAPPTIYMYEPDPITRQLQLQDGRRKYTLASLVDSSHLAGLVPVRGVLIHPRIRVPRNRPVRVRGSTSFDISSLPQLID
jgi:hypothetical protein